MEMAVATDIENHRNGAGIVRLSPPSPSIMGFSDQAFLQICALRLDTFGFLAACGRGSGSARALRLIISLIRLRLAFGHSGPSLDNRPRNPFNTGSLNFHQPPKRETVCISHSPAMRLLNTRTLDLEDFITVDQTPLYAILSHTWGADEVTFKDLRSGRPEEYQQKQGWRKITESARYASSRGWSHIWVDTCCIDKSDITELSEAINSMFHWYERAQVCYAYLADVPPMKSAGKHPWKWSFRSSRWFTRGWTLQELLAPSFLEFLDSDWNLIGSRDEWVDEIERATGIEVKQLANFQQCCIATKLSWAAHRQTTRVEDRAYSLLGLLGVHMPLIYGEGERAFARLQLELMRSSNDESILVWGPAMS